MDIQSLQKKAANIRLDSLTAMYKAKKGCVGGSMSVVEILVSLYYGKVFGKPVMKFDPKKPDWEEQDYLILSKGHAVPTLYAILADLGFFDKSELSYFAKEGCLLKGKPNFKVPGISASILSGGHGLSVGLGMAMSLQMDRKSNKVFVVMGDGELQNGQVWEAALACAHYNLSNLGLFIDNNKAQSGELISSVMNIPSIQDKFEAFGWNVIQVVDGHNFDQILDGVSRAVTSVRKPVCVWCHTVCGKGVDFAEGKPSYQRSVLSEGEMLVVTSKLKEVL